MFRASSTSLVLSSLRHDIPTQENFRGISTPSEQTAWVSGSHGTLLKTTNQGKIWQVKQIEDAKTLELRDIKAFNDDIAYVMSAGIGEESRIYKTVDGGKSWNLQLKGSASSEFFNCMAFWNRDHGMVLSDPIDGKFKVYVTKDGGASWATTPEKGMPVALNGEGAFAASGSCMTVHGELDAWFGTGINTARVFHTNDGGDNWQVVNTPIMQNSSTSGIFSMAFCDAKHGLISGGDYQDPKKGGSNVAATVDGGLTWNLYPTSPQYYWSAVAPPGIYQCGW